MAVLGRSRSGPPPDQILDPPLYIFIYTSLGWLLAFICEIFTHTKFSKAECFPLNHFTITNYSMLTLSI